MFNLENIKNLMKGSKEPINMTVRRMMRPYYVYVLIDPIDSEVFYVGKGKGRRLEQHKKSVDNGIERNKEKEERIKKIQLRKEEVLELVVGRFDTEEEAYAVESTLIKWVYGFSNLTNSVHGHYHENIRNNGNLKPIQGLDVEKKISPGDPVFTRELEIESERYSIKDKLLYLRKQLLLKNSKLEISEPDFTKKKDPSLYVKINNTARLQLMMRPSGTDVVIFNVRALKMDKHYNDSFIRKYEKHYDIKMRNFSDSYFKLDQWKGKKPPHYKNNVDYISEEVIRTIEELK
jgi:hypothetical protein